MTKSTEPATGELEFEFAEFFREIRGFKAMAMSFLDPGAEQALDQLQSSLSNIQSSAPLDRILPGTRGRPWEIYDWQPILTKPTRSYERGEREGGPRVFAKITSIWEVLPAAKKSKLDVPRRFKLAGKASVRVEWREEVSDEPEGRSLGVWRMEIADGASPGCFFHTQIMGEASCIEPQFPHAVPVPRLPSIAFTPMCVLEFVLGELFQDEWTGHTRVITPEVEDWRGIQYRRLKNLYDWQIKLIAGSETPPWTILKCEKPENGRFLNSP